MLSLIAIVFLTQGSDLSAYAERAGLPEIERWALAEAWKESTGRERERAANRFAGVLANAFLTHPERAAEFRTEAEPLIEALPSSSPARLRLEIELLAAQALPVEQSASSALCSFEPVEVDQIAIALTDVLDQSEKLFQRANARFESAANRSLRTNSEEKRTRLSESGGISENARTRSALLAGWARTFRVLLGVSEDPAMDQAEGLKAFAWVLAGEPSLPLPSDLPEAWYPRRYVSFAIHGVLLLESHAGLPDRWGRSLEQFGNAEDRRQSGFRRVLARAIANDPLAIREGLPDVVEHQELVMLLAYLLRAGPESVVEDVVESLVDREGLDALLGYATSFDPDLLNNRDLAALITAHFAFSNQLTRDGDPEPNPNSAPAWSALCDQLLAVNLRNRPGAIKHDTYARAAWSAWKSERFFDSAQAWSKAAEFGGNSADLASRRLQAFMKWKEAGGDPVTLPTESALFLQNYPDHPFAVEILLQQSGHQSASLDLVESLLAIPADSSRFLEAQARAEFMMFGLAKSGDMAFETHIDLALELHRLWLDSPEIMTPERIRVGLARARRLLESAGDLLAFSPVRREVLADLSDLRARGMVGISDLGAELDYRAVENAIASGDLASARALATELFANDPEGRWSRAANIRLVQWASKNPTEQVTPDVLRTVGLQVLGVLPKDATSDQLRLLIAPCFLPDQPNQASEVLAELRPECSRSASALVLFARIASLQSDHQIAAQRWANVRSKFSVGSERWCQSMVGEATAQLRLGLVDQATRLLAQLRGLGPNPLPERIASEVVELEHELLKPS